MNATQRGANLHPGVNLLPAANCAHEHGFRRERQKVDIRVRSAPLTTQNRLSHNAADC